MTSGKLRNFLQICAIASLAALTACAQPFQARVESFQAMPPAQGQSFYLAPDESAASGLEFSTYAALVGAELQRHGYRQVASAEGADLKVMVGYGSGPARERLATRPSLYSGMSMYPMGMYPMGWGWAGRGWAGSGFARYPGWYYDPFFDPWGGWNSSEVYSYTVYPAFLHVVIERVADQQHLFEGRAESAARSSDLPSTMPKLVAALFTDFPGQAVVSKVVKVPDAR